MQGTILFLSMKSGDFEDSIDQYQRFGFLVSKGLSDGKDRTVKILLI